jgi:hypothetical protein
LTATTTAGPTTDAAAAGLPDYLKIGITRTSPSRPGNRFLRLELDRAAAQPPTVSKSFSHLLEEYARESYGTIRRFLAHISDAAKRSIATHYSRLSPTRQIGRPSRLVPLRRAVVPRLRLSIFLARRPESTLWEGRFRRPAPRCRDCTGLTPSIISLPTNKVEATCRVSGFPSRDRHRVRACRYVRSSAHDQPLVPRQSVGRG